MWAFALFLLVSASTVIPVIWESVLLHSILELQSRKKKAHIEELQFSGYVWSAWICSFFFLFFFKVCPKLLAKPSGLPLCFQGESSIFFYEVGFDYFVMKAIIFSSHCDLNVFHQILFLTLLVAAVTMFTVIGKSTASSTSSSTLWRLLQKEPSEQWLESLPAFAVFQKTELFVIIIVVVAAFCLVVFFFVFCGHKY